MAKKAGYSSTELLALGEQRRYKGKDLDQIAFPLGGIGTGTVSLSGKGGLVDWEIFNRPNKGAVLPHSFVTLYAKKDGEAPITKVVQAPPSPPFSGSSNVPYGGIGFGVSRENGAGLPHFADCTFRGEYPFAYIDFDDVDMPVDVTLEAYNPFIPLNDDDSGIPVAILTYTVTNKTTKPVEITLAANLANVIGYPGKGSFYGDFLGQSHNQFYSEDGLSGLVMTSSRYHEQDFRFGSMAISTPWDDVTHQSYWYRGAWFDCLQYFWDEFSSTGEFKERLYTAEETEASQVGTQTQKRSTPDIGSLGLKAKLQPGETASLPLYISWYFPNFQKYWGSREGSCACGQCEPPTWRNYYAGHFTDAWNVAQYVKGNAKRLHAETKLFHDALFASSLPPYVLDAVSSQSSIIRSTTCLRLEDGTFYGFEGCHGDSGCCEGSCTHVWNYAQTLAFLFPKLERSLRDADYKYNQFEDGRMCFRLQLPLGADKWTFRAAADGQMGGVMKVYRDWKLCGDEEWLRSLWPKVKKALEYAWQEWDTDKDGVMEGVQHNTYDIEFYGPNTMMGSFYLGALKAGAEMAEHLGDTDSAEEYRTILESGKKIMDNELFNGDYYIQKYDPEVAPKYQYGEGCLSDQMIGQWFAHIVGLGYLFDQAKVKKTMESIFKFNWRSTMKDHANCQRIYALNDEAGLLLCSWPHGNRPPLPFVYSDEVWCGIEYQVASHLLYEGKTAEGLAIVKGLRDRHDGNRRNPWNEFECGSHYARSMASWSLLTALSGYQFDMSAGKLGFNPLINQDDFTSFWSVDSGWGTFQQQGGEDTTVKLKVEYGSVQLKELVLSCLTDNCAAVALDGEPIRATVVGNVVQFKEPITIACGQTLVLKA